ncbi:hypothetical protein L3X38_012450 [Prunus dulcis]|uniref:Uncharacterized protein n=1 Tax=Prunus dulcis TaxID=3755 RepID=A0AAD4ZGM9_PRUDU|nr:hypothetical protein L3X38_012450 [Prunus dulcis]
MPTLRTVTPRTGSAVAGYCPLWAWLHSHQPARFCFWELTKQLPRVVTHPGIAPASNSLNFGVPTNPKPVSSQKASHYIDAREQLDHASSSNATRMDSVEPIVDPNDQVMDIIQDAFPFASTNINHEREDDVPTPIDSGEAWKEFDRTFPEFATDPRNVRLGLATDGFNPFDVVMGPSSEDDVVIVEEEEEDWETERDDSDDNESYYSSDDE